MQNSRRMREKAGRVFLTFILRDTVRSDKKFEIIAVNRGRVDCPPFLLFIKDLTRDILGLDTRVIEIIVNRFRECYDIAQSDIALTRRPASLSKCLLNEYCRAKK